MDALCSESSARSFAFGFVSNAHVGDCLAPSRLFSSSPLSGKGRQISGIIFDSILRGNSTKHVWVSVSNDLYLEANRDLQALGCNAKVINGLQSIDEATGNKSWKSTHLPARLRDGVLFSTYATLVSGLNGQRGKRTCSRLDQVIQWCGGEEFDGVLVFDGQQHTPTHPPAAGIQAPFLSKRSPLRLAAAAVVV